MRYSARVKSATAISGLYATVLVVGALAIHANAQAAETPQKFTQTSWAVPSENDFADNKAGAQSTTQMPAPPEKPQSFSSDDKKTWDITLGMGAGLAPKYMGDDHYKMIPVPLISVTYKDTVFLNPAGIGANLVNSHGIKAGPILAPDFTGRYASDDHKRLDGMDKIHSSVSAGGFVSYKVGAFSVGGKFLQNVTDANYGFTAQTEANYRFALVPRKLYLEPGVEANFGSGKYMQTWFGVNEAEAARTGYAHYTPDGGLRDVGLKASLVYNWTDHWLVRAFTNVNVLVGDAADSPLVHREIQTIGGLGVAYHF